MVLSLIIQYKMFSLMSFFSSYTTFRFQNQKEFQHLCKIPQYEVPFIWPLKVCYLLKATWALHTYVKKCSVSPENGEKWSFLSSFQLVRHKCLHFKNQRLGDQCFLWVDKANSGTRKGIWHKCLAPITHLGALPESQESWLQAGPFLNGEVNF